MGAKKARGIAVTCVVALSLALMHLLALSMLWKKPEG